MKLYFTSSTHFMRSLYKKSIKKTVFLTFCSGILLFSINTKAQEDDYISRRSGLSLQFGMNSFLGDLGGNNGNGKPFIKDLNLKSSKLFTGLSYSYFFDKGLSINGDVHFTSVSAADSLSDQTPGHSLGRYNRNLSFKSSIYEMQITAELYPLQAISYYSTPKLMPYVGAGIGMFHFNPKTKLNGEWYYLQPLHLEGQGFAEFPERSNYKLTQLYIPLTLGVKYRITDNDLVSINAIFRKTFTDYIDDASTTYINPALFDKYLSPYAANIAKKLYYRGVSSPTPTTINYRGYTGNDSYTTVFLSFTHLF
jgi:hypothetical protein